MQRRHQVDNLQKDMDEKQAVFETIMQERDRLEMEREKHSLAFCKASETPIKIIKQIDILLDCIASLGQENLKQVHLSASLDRELERLSVKRRDIEAFRLTYTAEQDEFQAQLQELERIIDDISKEHELSKVQLSFQKSERIRLEQNLKRVIHEVNFLFNIFRLKESMI
jgi:chromosome segregation ATPase